MSDSPTPRYSARVLVIDAQDRVLLFEGRGLGDVPILWVPPGGGLEAGETYEQAAVRELWEETGLADVRLDACVWHRSMVLRWGEEQIESVEQWFVVRIGSLDIDGHVNPDVDESALTLGSRWWTVDEILAAHDYVFVPRQLGVLLGPILRGVYPDPPLRIGA